MNLFAQLGMSLRITRQFPGTRKLRSDEPDSIRVDTIVRRYHVPGGVRLVEEARRSLPVRRHREARPSRDPSGENGCAMDLRSM